MPVITISRQLGSLGRAVASVLVERQGYTLVWRDLINQAAQRAGVPEAALSQIDELGLLGFCPSPQACRAYRRAVEQVMREWADRGNVVIVGRAGQVVLADYPGAWHVRVVAPLALRAERVARAHAISPAAARAQVEASDAFRRQYLKRFYHVRWDDPDLYDLVVNTSRVTAETAADMVLQLISTNRVLEAAAG